MSGDLPVWLVFVVLLVLLGLRAWLVETSPAGGGSSRREVRAVTIAAGVTLFVLVVAVALRGGIDLVNLILNPPPPAPAPPLPVPVPAPAPVPKPGG